MIENLYQSKCYFFLFAHPDDELYVSVLANRLIKQWKDVHFIFITNWDSWWNPILRDEELKRSVSIIWLEEKNLHKMNVSEKDFSNKIKFIVTESCSLVEKYHWDCVFWIDYEWGHEWHDLTNFCASEIAKKCKINSLFLFPIYHWKYWERKWAKFKPERKNYIEIPIEEKEKNIKKWVLESHISQKWHFDWLQTSSNDYFDLLFWRELYFQVSETIDYTKKPMDDVWYEYHRNGFKFTDFTKVINCYHDDSF